MAHYVICSVCGKRFNRDKQPFIQTSKRRYAHYDCAVSEEKKKTQEEKDKEELDKYIKELFNIENIPQKIKKQISTYMKEYGYSYSGIHKTLIYCFEIKHNSLEKANGGIGIVPYCYKQAYDYFYSLWQAQQRNEKKEIKAYVPQEIVIKISSPERKPKKKKRFTFLDEEE